MGDTAASSPRPQGALLLRGTEPYRGPGGPASPSLYDLVKWKFTECWLHPQRHVTVRRNDRCRFGLYSRGVRAVNPRRLVRKDLGTISTERAREVLEECEPAILAEIAWAGRFLRWLPGFGLDDLHAIAQVAALEASLTYEPSRGTTLRNWASRTIHWRLSELLDTSNSPEIAVGDPFVDVDCSDLRAAVPFSASKCADPEGQAIEAEHTSWVQSAVGRLPPRQRTIVAGRMLGESMTMTAAFLGITVRQVYYDAAEAYDSLRSAAKTAGLVE